MPINPPMAAVFASYINRNPGYFLKGFRDSPHLADIFRQEVFEKMLTFLLELEGEPASDPEVMNYHTAVMVLLDKWSTTIKKPLDISLLFDPSIRWSRFRSDALCIVGSKSPAASRMVAKEQYPSESQPPNKSDYLSFLGAGLGVLLTVLAVTFYGDIFGGLKKHTKTVGKPLVLKESSQKAEEAEAEPVKEFEESTPALESSADKLKTEPTTSSTQEVIDSSAKSLAEPSEGAEAHDKETVYQVSVKEAHKATTSPETEKTKTRVEENPSTRNETTNFCDFNPYLLVYGSKISGEYNLCHTFQGFFVPIGELPTTVHGGVSLLKGRRVEKICPDEKKAYLDDKTCIKYDKCLIATGARTLIMLIGGGFLGSELAYSIRRKYKNVAVNQVIGETGNLSGILPEHLSIKAAESLRETGVNVITSAKVIEFLSFKPVLLLLDVTDHICSTEERRYRGGIMTDAELRVRTGIWAAGDAASFYDRSLGRRRIEHWENAQVKPPFRF
ncbi:unnamed protein product [Strongylus vulgaris]|uniref:Uncharacterized protein n=1 Tax=Strongylus vulgaris TaxID=40348 RepID=A0A3P7ISH7_STRVU|nr:unnamed protein product [Strongylus vulgaris]